MRITCPGGTRSWRQEKYEEQHVCRFSISGSKFWGYVLSVAFGAIGFGTVWFSVGDLAEQEDEVGAYRTSYNNAAQHLSLFQFITCMKTTSLNSRISLKKQDQRRIPTGFTSGQLHGAACSQWPFCRRHGDVCGQDQRQCSFRNDIF